MMHELMPETVVEIAVWVVLILGIGVVIAAAILVWCLWIWAMRVLREQHFSRDARAAARYLLWLVLRLARRPEADLLQRVPPEVGAWALSHAWCRYRSGGVVR